MRTLAAVAITVVLAGCATIPQNEGKPATVAEVVGKIKDDIDVYQKYDADAAKAKPLADACQGTVGLSITGVKIALTTQTDDTDGATGSATLPVGVATIGPSLSGSREVKGTQTLTFSLYPDPVAPTPVGVGPAPAAIDPASYPIAASLQQLRNGLLLASQRKPCVSLRPFKDPDGSQPKDDGGTFVFGFTVIKQASAGASIKFVVFSLGATATSQQQAGNTITVTFKARPGSAAALVE